MFSQSNLENLRAARRASREMQQAEFAIVQQNKAAANSTIDDNARAIEHRPASNFGISEKPAK
jgi:hypothetical protein